MADEVSLSVEETNKLRASLGLAPLRTAPPAAATPSVRAAAEPESRQGGADKQQRRSRRGSSGTHRRDDNKHAKVKSLGAAEDGGVGAGDDVLDWVQRTRHKEQEEAAQQLKKQQEAQQRLVAARGAQSESEDGEEPDDKAPVPAGLRLGKDYADAVGSGETVVLTLADKTILNERGELADESDEDGVEDQLQDVLREEDARRAKARRASSKQAKPLFSEDGKRRGLLDKYDEEEAEAMVDLGELLARQRDEARRRLAEGAVAPTVESGEGAAPGAGTGTGDYLSQQETTTAFGKKDKKRKRKLRQREPALDLDAMEAQAAAQRSSGSDLGSRTARREQLRERAQQEVAAHAEKRARFDAAVAAANERSLGLRQAARSTNNHTGRQEGVPEVAMEDAGEASTGADEPVARRFVLPVHSGDDAEEVEVGDEADRELEESLTRARRLAQQRDAAAPEASFSSLAQSLGQARERDEAQARAAAAAGLHFTETTEFVRNIQLRQAAADARPGESLGPGEREGAAGRMAEQQGDDDEPMEGEDDANGDAPEDPGQAAAAAAAAARRAGGWLPAEVVASAQTAAEAAPPQRTREPAAATAAPQQGGGDVEVEGIVREKPVGRGLAGVLGLLHESGGLRASHDWSGRTNDVKKSKLAGLEDVYTGGASEDRLARGIEIALTEKDEYGRVMTPKERFRALCYRFHGKDPSKNKQEKRLRKFAEEVAVKRAATSENPSEELQRLRMVQRTIGTPFVVLSGAGTASQGAKLAAATHAAGGAAAGTPSLGGGLTPLTGDRKVEAMLSISKPGGGGGGGSSSKGSAMPPPAPRKGGKA